MIRASIEYLHHFTCGKCLGWWSIASHENYTPKKLHCPHCGEKHDELEYVTVPKTKI